MMLARLACMTRAYRALVGPLVTRSMTPIRSGRRGRPPRKKVHHNSRRGFRAQAWVRARSFGDLPTAARRGLSELLPDGAPRYGTLPGERCRGRPRADEAYGRRGPRVALEN